MPRYLLWRVVQFAPVLWVVATLLFVLVQLTPGGPIVALAGEFAEVDTIRQIERQLGLDLPLAQQYGQFLGRLAYGDLGFSYFYKAPVLEVILSRLPATLVLVFASLALSAALGVMLGIISARGGSGAVVILLVALLTLALPVFWLGHLLRLGLSVELGLFPVQGMSNARIEHTGLASALDVARHAALPVLTLVLHQLAFAILLTRAAMAVETQRPYYLTARAKGHTRLGAELGHAFPNASLPIVTLFANRAGGFIAGTVLVETVFAWPGLGQLVTGAIANRDRPLVIGIVLLVTLATLVANLIADIYAFWLDPRIAPERRPA